MSQPSTLVMPLTRPEFRSYLIGALLDWCEDEGMTPHVYVAVDDSVTVPREYVNPDGSIVLCVSREATHGLTIDRDGMAFQARFGEVARSIYLPIGRIAAVYPEEDTSMVSYFPVLETPAGENRPAAKHDDDEDDLPTFAKV